MALYETIFESHRRGRKERHMARARNIGMLGAGFVCLALALFQIVRASGAHGSALLALALVVISGTLISLGSMLTIEQSLGKQPFGKK